MNCKFLDSITYLDYMNNQQIIDRFYNSFAAIDIDAMLACYHEQLTFKDPAFGALNADQAKTMWTMLLERSKGNIQIEHMNVKADEHTGSAEWIARYPFGKKQRPVVNHIKAQFRFQDGKIIQHHDHFDVWKWSSQALGLPGMLLGWSPFIKNKIQKQSLQLLNNYQAK